MTNETAEQLNTAIEEPDYKAMYYALKEESIFKDTVIAGLRDLTNEKDAIIKNQDAVIKDRDKTIAQQGNMLKQKNNTIAAYEASGTKSTNREKIKQQEKNLELEDKVELLQAAARENSKPEDLARITEFEKQVTGYEQMGKNYLELQIKFDALLDQYNLLLEDMRQLKTSYNNVVQLNIVLRKGCDRSLLDEFDRLHSIIDKQAAELKQKDDLYEKCVSQMTSMQKKMDEKDQEIRHLSAIFNHNSGNTNLPPSKDTIAHKEERRKRVHNLRVKTNRKPGGQENHPANFLKPLPEKLYDKVIKEVANPPLDSMKCPYCGCDEIEYTDETATQDEICLEIVCYLKKKTIHGCRCKNCMKTINSRELQKYREAPCIYGGDMEAISAFLTNVCNVPVNKVVSFFEGISKRRVVPSPGWICKNDERMAKRADGFYDDVRYEMIKQDLIQWDETVIPVDGQNAYLRIYTNNRLAWYAAHAHKNFATIVKDGILPRLSTKTKVVHDGCNMNYAKGLDFIHALCIVHFMRQLMGLTCDTKHDAWKKMKDKAWESLKEREAWMEQKKAKKFTEQYRAEFKAKFMELLAEAEIENERDAKLNPEDDFFTAERNFINKIRQEYDRYFLWMTDFSIPPDNNLCERSLRPVKSKTKQAGQFKSLDGAQQYAVIKSYLDTCERNGKSKFEAIQRLAQDNAYTLAEILGDKA